MSAKIAEEDRNEQVIRSLYALAEGNAKDTSKFVSIFTDDGYFYDVAADKKIFRPRHRRDGRCVRRRISGHAQGNLRSPQLQRPRLGRAVSQRHPQRRPRYPGGNDTAHRQGDARALLRRSFGFQGRKDASGSLAVESSIGHAHLSLCEDETERVRRHRFADLLPLLPLESWRRRHKTGAAPEWLLPGKHSFLAGGQH